MLPEPSTASKSCLQDESGGGAVFHIPLFTNSGIFRPYTEILDFNSVQEETGVTQYIQEYMACS